MSTASNRDPAQSETNAGITAMTRDLTSAFLTGSLLEFVPLPPRDLRAASQVDRSRTDRAGLSAALFDLNSRLGAPDAVLAACRRLADQGVVAVAAGQQTGLLTGPLYTVIKALTAAAVADRLEALGQPAVPVFWSASQDADTTEMSHALVLDAGEQLRTLRVDLPESRPSGSTPLDGEWVETTAAWIERESGLPYALDAGLLIRDAAASSKTYADWFSAILLRILANHAIPVLDPMQPALAALARPVLAGELENPARSAEAITEAGRRLAGMGLHAQLHRRQDASNLFLEEHGRRQALRLRDGALATPSRTYTTAELQSILAAEPWRITPAAGLRPVVQDLILPTAVNVVGLNELAYLAQLKGVYDLHLIEPALPWLRPSLILIEPPVGRVLATRGLDLDTFLGDPAGAELRALVDASNLALALQTARAQVQGAMDMLQGRFATILDEPLGRSVERSRRGVLSHLERLERLAARAQARKDAIITDQFRRLQTHLLPGGIPQERSLSIFSSWLRHGPRVVTAMAATPPEGIHAVHL